MGEGESVTIPRRDVTIQSKPAAAAAADGAGAGPGAGGGGGNETPGASSAANGGAAGPPGGNLAKRFAAAGSLPTEAQTYCENGGVVGSGYAWSQTKDSVTIGAFVPKGTRASSVVVEVTAKRISISTVTKRAGGTASTSAVPVPENALPLLLPHGTTVTTFGLTSAKYNNKTGKVVPPSRGAAKLQPGRVAVLLDGEAKPIAFKRTNLQASPVGDAAAAAGAAGAAAGAGAGGGDGAGGAAVAVVVEGELWSDAREKQKHCNIAR